MCICSTLLSHLDDTIAVPEHPVRTCQNTSYPFDIISQCPICVYSGVDIQSA